MTNNILEELIQLIVKEDVDSFNALKEKENISEIDLSGTDLESLSLNNIDLSELDLNGVNFGDSSLENAIFTNANLTSANFTGANIQYCNFNNANLSGAHLTGCNAANADFNDANLSGADLREADFTDAKFSASINLSQAKFDSLTVWPDNQNLPDDFDSDYSGLSDYSDDDYEEKLYDGELEDN